MKKIWAVTLSLITASSAWGSSVQEAPAPQPRAVRPSRAYPARPAIAAAPRARAFAYAWGGEMSGSYLGIDIREVTSDRVAALKLKEERGVEITTVDQDAPAGKAGLKEQDVILDFNGQRVEGREQLSRLLRETPAGRVVTLSIVRGGQPMQIKATLASRKDLIAKKMHKEKIVIPRIEIPEIEVPEIEMPAFEVVTRAYSRTTGMMVDNLTPQLGEFFGVKGGEGVLVRSVEKGSVAEAAGLKAGDVIVRVDNEAIQDRSDYRRALRNRDGTVKVAIVRDKKEQTVTMNMPARRQPRESSENDDFDDDISREFDSEFESADHLRPAFELAAPGVIAAPRTRLAWNESDEVDFDFDFDHQLGESGDQQPCSERTML